MDDKLKDFWEEHDKKLTVIIGKLSIPLMQTQHPMVRECHQDLIDLSIWVDHQMEALGV